MYLKSIRGPIDVVFLNRCSVSSVPVVFPVLPPEEILQCAKTAMFTSDEKKNGPGPSQVSSDGSKYKLMAVDDM